MSIANIRMSKEDQLESYRNLKAFMEVSKRIKARKEKGDEHTIRPETIRHDS